MTSSSDIVVPSIGDITDPDLIQTIKDAIAAREANSTISGTLAVGGNLTVTGVGGLLVAYKTADESVNNASTGSTLQNDDHLVLSGVANAVYVGVLSASYTGNTTDDAKWRFSMSSACDFFHSVSQRMPAAATSGSGTTVDLGAESLASVTVTATITIGAAAGQFALLAWFTWGVGSSASTLTFQWAQNAAGATNLTFKKGSFLMAWRIA